MTLPQLDAAHLLTRVAERIPAPLRGNIVVIVHPGGAVTAW